MPEVVYVLPSGEVQRIHANEGQTIMRAAVDNLVPVIVAECGGQLSCGTCHVFVDERWSAKLPPMSDDEAYMLEVTATAATERSRLSCQLVYHPDLSGMTVHVPDAQ